MLVSAGSALESEANQRGQALRLGVGLAAEHGVAVDERNGREPATRFERLAHVTIETRNRGAARQDERPERQ